MLAVEDGRTGYLILRSAVAALASRFRLQLGRRCLQQTQRKTRQRGQPIQTSAVPLSMRHAPARSSSIMSPIQRPFRRRPGFTFRLRVTLLRDHLQWNHRRWMRHQVDTIEVELTSQHDRTGIVISIIFLLINMVYSGGRSGGSNHCAHSDNGLQMAARDKEYVVGREGHIRSFPTQDALQWYW